MKEWKEYKLGDISSMKYGKLPPSTKGGKYPVWSGYRYVGMSDTYNCAMGALVVVARGVGGTGDVKIAKEDCYLTNLSISVNLDTSICNPYFVHYKYLLRNLRYLDSGSAQSQITIDALKNLSIELPSLDYQDKVVSILKSLDDKIEVNQRINDNLEQQARALFKSWLANCHKEVTIGDMSLNITDYSKCNSSHVVLVNSSDVTNGYFDHHILSENKKLKGHFKKRFRKGDILYSQVRPRNRHWAYCTFDADYYLASTQLMIIRNKDEVLPSILLYQYLIDDDVWMDFTLKTETRSGTFPQGNYEELSSIRVPFGADMNEIVPALESIYSLMYKNYKESRRLAILRDALLPELMSGKLKVNEL